MLKYLLISLVFLFNSNPIFSQAKLLIPMEVDQSDHLKAYGIAYRHLLAGKELDWLLNFRSGSFMFDYSAQVEDECKTNGVSYELLSGTQAAQIYAEVQSEDVNMELVRLEKVARIAVYVPPDAPPWDDAVQLALEYAGIPYDKLWDEEVLTGGLKKYDWLHLHHEDFTGQYGRFWSNFRNATWYREDVKNQESLPKVTPA